MIVPRVRVTTRSLLPRACRARAEAALKANAPAAPVPQQALVVPVRVLPAPAAPRAHVRALRVRPALQALAVRQGPAETVRPPA
jgi:hypothetical protein